MIKELRNLVSNYKYNKRVKFWENRIFLLPCNAESVNQMPEAFKLKIKSLIRELATSYDFKGEAAVIEGRIVGIFKANKLLLIPKVAKEIDLIKILINSINLAKNFEDLDDLLGCWEKKMDKKSPTSVPALLHREKIKMREMREFAISQQDRRCENYSKGIEEGIYIALDFLGTHIVKNLPVVKDLLNTIKSAKENNDWAAVKESIKIFE